MDNNEFSTPITSEGIDIIGTSYNYDKAINKINLLKELEQELKDNRNKINIYNKNIKIKFINIILTNIFIIISGGIIINFIPNIINEILLSTLLIIPITYGINIYKYGTFKKIINSIDLLEKKNNEIYNNKIKLQEQIRKLERKDNNIQYNNIYKNNKTKKLILTK